MEKFCNIRLIVFKLATRKVLNTIQLNLAISLEKRKIPLDPVSFSTISNFLFLLKNRYLD